MRLKKVAGLLCVGILLLSITTTGAQEEEVKKFRNFPSVSNRVPYVVEIFTSQGCSSCPPTDKLVSALYKEAAEQNIKLDVIAWHVDYWDYIGWRDPYGAAENSQRQRQYARHMNSRTIYTPQVLINGYSEVANPYQPNSFLMALRTVDEQQRQAVDIELGEVQVRSDTIEIPYKQLASQDTSSLLGNVYDIGVVVVENDLVTTPNRGENNGRRLENNHVARASHFTRLRNQGEVSVSLPADINRENSNVLVIVQHRQTQQIAFSQSIQLL